MTTDINERQKLLDYIDSKNDGLLQTVKGLGTFEDIRKHYKTYHNRTFGDLEGLAVTYTDTIVRHMGFYRATILECPAQAVSLLQIAGMLIIDFTDPRAHYQGQIKGTKIEVFFNTENNDLRYFK